MRRPTLPNAALGLCGGLALHLACARVEPRAPDAAAPPAEAAAAASDESAAATSAAKGPETTLRVSSAPVEALRSPYFAALEITFQNPSSDWHQVRRVFIGPERQLFGPALESLAGERLRAWQLAAREARQGQPGPPHPALETLAADVPAKSEPGAEPAGAGAPPEHLLACPFTVAPGLLTRKWVVLYSAAPDALLGQDLVLAYELENGKVERVLVQYPKPAPAPE